MRTFAVVALLATLAAPYAAGDCTNERPTVKLGTDPDAPRVSFAVLPTTIAALRSMVAPRPLPQAGRVTPVEVTQYSVTATLTELRITAAGDDVLVLTDDIGNSMRAVIPNPDCGADNGAIGVRLRNARAQLETRFHPTTQPQRVSVPVEVRGVGFFDYIRGETGAAPNGLALEPVLDLNFSPAVPPTPPAAHAGRRRASPPLTGCARPGVTIRSSKPAICSGESFEVTWQASEPSATVSIDGIGQNLPSSGTRTLGATFAQFFAARAKNACGIGFESTLYVPIRPLPDGNLSASQSSIAQGASTTLNVTANGASSWSLASSLGNTIARTSGTGSGSFTTSYIGTIPGTDTLTLTLTNECGASAKRTITLTVRGAANPPTAALSTSSPSLSPGSYATLTISVNNVTSWSLSSSLHNSMSPSSGTTSGTTTSSYYAAFSGTDTITLTATGAGGTVQRTTTITIGSTPPPPPQPPTGGLQCCDGSRSPSCFNCGNKRGCCSGHGGVCGC